MCPTITENPPLADPLDADHFDVDRHTAGLLDTDRRNAARLDAILCDTVLHGVCHRNAYLRTASLRGADLHNVGRRNAESSELLLEGISSEGSNQAMETGVDGFEASKTGEESRSVHEKRNPASRRFAAAECFARPQSKRNQCWAQ
jgi:uncharacterized protein YjbI with pentapeptide repeats